MSALVLMLGMAMGWPVAEPCAVSAGNELLLAKESGTGAISAQWADLSSGAAGHRLLLADDKQDIPDAVNRGGIEAELSPTVVTATLPGMVPPSLPLDGRLEIRYLQLIQTCCNGVLEGPV